MMSMRSLASTLSNVTLSFDALLVAFQMKKDGWIGFRKNTTSQAAITFSLGNYKSFIRSPIASAPSPPPLSSLFVAWIKTRL